MVIIKNVQIMNVSINININNKMQYLSFMIESQNQ